LEKAAQIISVEKEFRDDALLNGLLKIWESSVRSSHSFLSQKDIEDLIPLVKDGIKTVERLFIFGDSKDACRAFMAIAKDKIEMLFVGAEYRGAKIGGKLIQYAINELNVGFVDVNEQNDLAIGFYAKYGFETLSRSETDDYGRAFPILRLGRPKSRQ
jgi:putative acetyltransferase